MIILFETRVSTATNLRINPVVGGIPPSDRIIRKNQIELTWPIEEIKLVDLGEVAAVCASRSMIGVVRII